MSNEPESPGPKPAGPKPEAAKPQATKPSPEAPKQPKEIGGPEGPEPTRYGDWERNGRVSDF